MIQIPLSVYKIILKFALTESNPYTSRKDWKEVVGVLIGRMGEEEIEITDAIFLGSGNAVFVEATDYSAITQHLPYERIEKGESIVAWWHSHPGLGLFLSGTDVNTQSSYQKLDNRTFALVIDPTKVTAKKPGIAIFRVNELDYSYFEADFLITPSANYQILKESTILELYEEVEVPRIKIDPPALTPAILDRVEIALSCRSLINSSEYELVIGRSGESNKFLGLSYNIKTTNLILKTNWIRTTFTHRCTEEGTLAYLRFMKNDKESGEIRLEDILVWNSSKEVQHLNSCRINISG